MRYLSVCSGIEAASVAWQPLGWEPAMFAEIDPFCCWLLRSRYSASRPVHMPSPHEASDRKEARRRAAAIRNIVALPTDGAVINAGDFTKIGKQDVGTIDLLAGGTPCQSFSIAGKRAGLDDPRGNLTIEFARLADRLRPLWVVWENVPGVLSIDDGRTFGAFLGMLVQLGMASHGESWTLNTSEYPSDGAVSSLSDVLETGELPRRFYLSGRACRGILRRAEKRGKTLPPPLAHALMAVAASEQTSTSTAALIQQLAFGGNNTAGPIDVATAANACASASGRMDFETETFIAHSLSADGFDASEDGTGRGVPMIPIAICTAHTQSNGSGFSDGVAHTLESVPSQVVAFNLRGRDGGALPEVSDAASLRAASGGSSNSYVAFSAKDSGADVSDIAPTLRSMNNRGGNPNGGGQVAIAFTLPGSDGTVSTATPTDVAGSVRTKAPGSIENSSTTAVLQEQPVAWSGELTASTDTAGTFNVAAKVAGSMES